ncbi:competence type IV pilus major pilin ComGC [Pediococcus argentinicus]|uniref:Competence protein ComGC n=1 Tax=Pediococcus argentinicus TaxID=480391 RepID=A0A0R2NJ70_9LACO|nr:competence type IV pilus major pilin ComGC [Pediococcus argentinicus]KRO22938.1 hypothetical protein IV88_GL001067 [Pediococcus argentinicus]NKZ22967.1 prepilin-type N-terminal cleavage/methylation domain-containing protein [Pediococcus argentinicus]GEP20040.1 competence protein ComGC [Pediococcus argentinicus]
MKFVKRKAKGFTLIEMTIVLFIVSLLILVIIPNISNQRKNAKHIQGNAMTEVVQTQVDLYENEYASLPHSLQELEDKGYLNKKQLADAQRNGIKIEKDKVVQE